MSDVLHGARDVWGPPEPNGTPAPAETRPYLVPFYPGDDRKILLTVSVIAGFPRGLDGSCAFCHGDPCADYSGPETLIGNYAARLGRTFETCPCCAGRPT